MNKKFPKLLLSNLKPGQYFQEYNQDILTYQVANFTVNESVENYSLFSNQVLVINTNSGEVCYMENKQVYLVSA